MLYQKNSSILCTIYYKMESEVNRWIGTEPCSDIFVLYQAVIVKRILRLKGKLTIYE